MTAAKPRKKAARDYVKHGVYKTKREILEQAGRRLDRRRVLDRAILEWEASVIADLGGEGNLTTLQAGMLRALAWDRLFLDSAAAAMANMQLVNKRNKRFHRVVLERAQLEDSFARRAAQLGLERKARPALSLPEYIESRYGAGSPEPGDGQAAMPGNRQPDGKGRRSSSKRASKTASTSDAI